MSKRIRFVFASLFMLLVMEASVLVADSLVTIIDESNWKDVAPSGKEADWIYGDFVIRNEHLVAVIAKPSPIRDANMTVREVGGCLIDLTQRENQSDQLSAYYPGGRLFEFKADGQLEETATSAKLSFVGTPIEDQPDIAGLKHTVIYSVTADADYLELQSRVENTTDKPIEIGLFDSVRADRDFTMKVHEPFNTFVAADYWWEQAYAVTAQGSTISYEQQKRSNLLHFRKGDETKVTLKPGESIEYRRAIRASRHSAGAIGDVAAASNKAGIVRFDVVDADGPIRGAKLTFNVGDEEFAVARTDKEGKAYFQLPEGKYDVVASAIGRPDEEFQGFDVMKRPPVELKFDMDQPAYVVAKISDVDGQPIACKVEFDAEEVDGDPYFGPDTYAWEVRNLIYTEDGAFRHAIPPGKYNVIISHGNEYDAVTKQITTTRGEETKIEATLKRTVDTTGWISADFHSHSSPSGDNTSSQLGRVLNLMAEHIEFAPCTEHQRVSTYEPHIKRLGGEGRIATCTGMELTGGPLPVNHQNAFPLHHHPHTQDGGGPRTSVDPIEQIKRIKGWDDGADKIVQENHPDIPRILCDSNEDGKPDDGFRGMLEFMDVIEVHPPYLVLSPPEKSNPDNLFGNQMVHWLQMLNLGFRIPGVVNTDSHFTFHGSGWLRNYVKCSTDDPAKIETSEMVSASRQGNLVMSNGPFLEVTAADSDGTTGQTAIPGDDLSAPSKRVKLTIKVQCANWLDVNRVQVLVNGRAQEELNFKQRDPETKFRNGTVKFEETLEVALSEDAHLVVAVLGEGLGLGPVAGPDHAKDPPCAVSNPIFVDVDGGGFKPNKDLLDIPLPAGIDALPQR